jgi:thiamine-monophosphate kinase
LARGRMGRIGAGEHPQMFPEPRVAVGVALRRRGLAGACIDLSDGLSTDLGHLCEESGVGAEVEEALLPVHPLALGARALEFALNGGEDYELLFSAGADVKVPRSLAGVTITRIGRLVRGSTVTLVRADGRRERLEAGGWEHFRGSD